MYSINCRGRLLILDKPVVMGIINCTPDSFYKTSRTNLDEAVYLTEKMLEEGAAILDIGGQSTRPGSIAISAEEEMNRVIPLIQKVHQTFPEAIISVDTFYASVAKQAVDAGASIVNDISSGDEDAEMISTVAALQVPFICMHKKGKPETMQQNPQYENVVQEVLDYFIKKVDQCRKAGIIDLIIDPGFGFGKTPEHNFTLLKNLEVFKMLEKPILAGLSRKGMIYKTLQTTPENALNGTTVLNTLALQNGASILRVHDVKEAVEAITLFNTYRGLS